MAETLKPCPFCGGEAEFRDGSSTKPYIRCKSCGCRTWGSYAYDKLTAAWNRRAERTCRMVDNGCELCCSECDCRHDYDDEPNYCHNCGARVVSA